MKWKTMFWIINAVTFLVMIYSAFDIGKSLGRKEIMAEMTKPGFVGEFINQDSESFFDKNYVGKYIALKLVIDPKWYASGKEGFPKIAEKFRRNGRPGGAVEIVFDFGDREVQKSFEDFEEFIGFDPSASKESEATR